MRWVDSITYSVNMNLSKLQEVVHTTVAAQMVNLPAVQEIQAWTLGQEDPLEKEMAAHFSILAWKIPWAEEPGRLQSIGHKELDMMNN